MQQKICSKGEYYIMNRQELLGFFLQEKELIQFYVVDVKRMTVAIATDLIM